MEGQYIQGVPKKWEFSDEFDIVFVTLLLEFSCFTKYNRMQSKHKQTKCEHSTIADETLTDHSFLSRYHYTK